MTKQNSIIIELSIVASAIIVTHGFKPAEAALGSHNYSMHVSPVSVGTAWRIHNGTGAVALCSAVSPTGEGASCGKWIK